MRKGELIFNYLIFFGPLFLGIGILTVVSLAFAMPRTVFWSFVILYIAGLSLFVKAKLSVIKQGRLISFGTANMSSPNKVAYFVGYSAMVIASLLLLGLVLVTRGT